MSKLKPVALATLAMAAFLVLAGPAAARSRDRNHDRIPDRWEAKHHLSLHVNQARRDQDRDGLRNLAEFKAGDNPRDADSDNDGTKDGAEHAGKVASFTGGVLTINLFGGGTISGAVTDQTELKCDDTAMASSHGDDGDGSNSGPGGGDNSGPGSGDDQSGDDPAGHDQGDDPAGHDQGDDHGDDPAGDDNDNDDQAGDDQGDDNDNDDQGADNQSCGTDQLTAGREVKQAELRLANGTATFKEVELAP